jgi:hypothetical protein
MLGSGRTNGPGTWKTDNGYVLDLAGAPVTLEVRDVSLQAPGSSSGSATFDPANPPAGYTLCHGGHCHRADGALIDYADVQAELASGGGAAAPTTLLTLAPVSPVLAVRPGDAASIALGACIPGCELPRGTISRAPLRFVTVKASGQVSSAPGTAALPGGTVAWRFTLADVVLAGPSLSLAIDRGTPPGFTLGGTIAVTDRLFDGLDWARLAASGSPVQLDADAASRETLVANVAKSAWTPTLLPVTGAPSSLLELRP